MDRVNDSELKQATLSNNLVHYYQVRMSSFSDFSTRTWQRFNWFMTVHLGGFALVFSSIVKVEHSDWYSVVTVCIGATALVWCLLGYEDFKQMNRYGVECKEIERVLIEALDERENIQFNKFTVKATNKFSFFSHSRILYLFPIIVFFAWGLLTAYLF